MTKNEADIREFLAGIGHDQDPVMTTNVGGLPVSNAWTASRYYPERGIGYTVISYDGKFMCRIDLTKDVLSPSSVGELAGKIFNQ